MDKEKMKAVFKKAAPKEKLTEKHWLTPEGHPRPFVEIGPDDVGKPVYEFFASEYLRSDHDSPRFGHAARPSRTVLPEDVGKRMYDGTSKIERDAEFAFRRQEQGVATVPSIVGKTEVRHVWASVTNEGEITYFHHTFEGDDEDDARERAASHSIDSGGRLARITIESRITSAVWVAEGS